LKTRTTNDNTEASSMRCGYQTIFSVSIALALTGRSITRAVQCHFHGIVQKKPIHNVKD